MSTTSIVTTTDSGLYRYFMNDIVRATGRFHATPTIEFVQKGKGVTNITGEKLYESQAIAAVQRAEEKLGFVSRFFVMLADTGSSVYRLLIEPSGCLAREPLARMVDEELCRSNVEYAQKRRSGRLGPLEVRILREGAGEAYKVFCVSRGQREAQFKTLALQYADEFHFAWADHARDEDEEDGQ